MKKLDCLRCYQSKPREEFPTNIDGECSPYCEICVREACELIRKGADK